MLDTPRIFQSIDFADINHIIFDCDDTLYPARLSAYPRGTDSALHQRIKNNIRDVVDQDAEMLAVLGTERLDMPRIGEIFGQIVKHYQAQGPKALNGILERFYNVDYDFPPEPDLVQRLKDLKQQGVRLGIDTNGTRLNVEKVLARHGIPDDVFEGNIYDMVTAQMGKGTSARAQEVITRFGITHPAHCLYADDTPDVLKSMKIAGFRTAWINDTDRKLAGDMHPYIDVVYPTSAMLAADILSVHLAPKYCPADLNKKHNI